MISRRTALAGLGAAVAVGAAPAARAQAMPLRVGILPIFDVAPYYAAQQQGYFAAENIVAETTIVRGGAAGIPALVGGSLDVLYTNCVSVVSAIASGIDLRIILQGIQIGKAPPDPGGMVKRKGDPFKTGKDLEGHTIAANGLRDLGWMFVQAWIKETGGDTEKIPVVEIAMAAQAEALKAKRVDAAFLLEPFFTLALADPAVELLSWPMSKVFADGPAAFYVVKPELAAQRPAEVRAFVRAYKRGAAWINANAGKEPLYDLIASFSGAKPEVIRKVIMPPANATVTPAVLPKVTELMAETGVPTGSVDLRSKIFQ